jgi:hypothetical protein
MVVEIKNVLRVVMPCRVFVGYPHFRGQSVLPPSSPWMQQGPQMLVSYHITTWCHNPEDLNLDHCSYWGKDLQMEVHELYKLRVLFKNL